jgi:hypothetical protein
MHSTTSVAASHDLSTADHELDDAVLALRRVLEALPEAETFADQERLALDVTNEVCRRYIEQTLQDLADSHPDEVRVDGRHYRRHERGTVAYHSLYGDVSVQRCSYRLIGVHNGPTIIPLELAAGIIENATPALAYSIADGIAEMPSRRYEQILHAAHRRPPSRSAVERLAKRLGNEVKRDIMMVEGIVRCHEVLPEGAHAISVGLDRTTVPMAEERPPSSPPSSRRKRRVRPRVRRAPHPIDVCYRMVYVGTVTVVDRDGEALVTRKYAATPEEGPDDLVARVMADVTHLRAQRRLPVVVVQDGAPELWGLMWTALREAGFPKKEWNCVVDRFHVTERIAASLLEVEPDDSARASKLEHWRTRMEESNRGVHEFCDWLGSRMIAEPKLRSRVRDHLAYLEAQALRGYTRYRSCREKGFPTASGITEGACKSLVSARFKRSGQRWQQDGLTAILTLRSVSQSERMPTLWPLFARRYQRDVQIAC